MKPDDFVIDWNQYPKLASVFKDRPRVNVYWDELARFVSAQLATAEGERERLEGLAEVFKKMSVASAGAAERAEARAVAAEQRALELSAELETLEGVDRQLQDTQADYGALETKLAAAEARVAELEGAGERMVTPEVLQSTKDRLYGEIHTLRADLGVLAHAYDHDTRPPDDVLTRARAALAVSLRGPAPPEPLKPACPCGGTGRETGLGGYDEPCRYCQPLPPAAVPAPDPLAWTRQCERIGCGKPALLGRGHCGDACFKADLARAAAAPAPEPPPGETRERIEAAIKAAVVEVTSIPCAHSSPPVCAGCAENVARVAAGKVLAARRVPSGGGGE